MTPIGNTLSLKAFHMQRSRPSPEHTPCEGNQMKPTQRNLSPMRSQRAVIALFASLALYAAYALYAPYVQAQETRRAEATRAELQASLVELEQYAASSGYSGRLRDQKRREAALIKERLELGDIQVGDSVELAVVGEKDYSGTFPVVAGRVLSLPGLPDIPLKGVLRSEARDYLTGKLATYIKDPQVRVRTTIRLSVFGSVGRPGFYQVPADALA